MAAFTRSRGDTSIDKIVKYVATGRFLLGTIVGALTAAGIIGPEWQALFLTLLGEQP